MRSPTTGEAASATQFAGVQSVTSHVRRFRSLNEAAFRAAYGDANQQQLAAWIVADNMTD